MINLMSGTLAFLNPWILLGLLGLPVIWFLLKVFPPVPRMIHLPGAWLLEGLVPDRQTTSKTPWWLLLLRTLLTALILLALAHPVINPAESLNIRGALRLVIDNDWASAQTWSQQIQAANQILDRASRDQLETYILTTAPEPGQTTISQQGPMPAARAKTIVNGLKTHPWPASYTAANAAISDTARKNSIETIWVANGLNNLQGIDFAKALQQQGSLTYMEPDAAQRPILLRPYKRTGHNSQVAITAAGGFPENMPVGVDALSSDGRILDHQDIILQSKNMPGEVEFKLPDTLRGQIYQFRLSGRSGAGAVVITNNTLNRKLVGIVSSRDERKSAPLVESSYYISRALEPHADIQSGELDDLLQQKNISSIILPDIGTLPAGTLDKLEKWVRNGGLLLRMAGPNMGKSENFLTPTPLRKGERALSGSLTWDKIQKIAPFPKSSPFYGIDIQPDIEVRQQILPEPVSDLDKKTWAALEDGTPLVTAAALDKGLIVLIHTTATPQWSNLALSGLYVQILQRITDLSGLDSTAMITDGTLHPQKVFNGLGALEPPGQTAQPIDAKKFETTLPDSSHPPGIYGHAGVSKTMNIGDRIKTLSAMPSLPSGVTRTGYTHGQEKDLMPLLLAFSFFLFLIDWCIVIGLQGFIQKFDSVRLRKRILPIIVGTILSISTMIAPAKAEDTTITPSMIAQAATIHLAYIQSGIPSIDGTAQQGLENLAKTISARTSVEPAGVAALNPEKDDLSFFPLIYWPVGGHEQPLSQRAIQKIQYYLDHGGTILFDTRNNGTTDNTTLALRNLTNELDIPPLVKAPSDHVLTKSFYLLSSFPGRYDSNILWIEEQSSNGRDGVSSVIIGGNDWAAAWAGISPPQDSQQQEISLRFGINLIMYTLTGNYKADQVHLPHILERLGQ